MIFAKYLFFNTNTDTRNTLLIAGSGRSGTTWISDIINYNNEYRDIFEPFAPHYTKEWRTFQYKQYLRPGDKRKDVLQAARFILSGRVSNRWANGYNKKFFCTKRIVKDIRANFFLKWIKVHFPEIPVIFIMRHPCAVALSRMQLGWRTHLNEIMGQWELRQDFLSAFFPLRQELKTEFEKQIFLWCIENYVPLRQLEKDEFYLLFYENLCSQPELEAKLLFNWLGKKYENKVASAFRKPSAVSDRTSAILTGENLVSKWRARLKDEEIADGFRIIKKFGLDKYYDSGITPKIETTGKKG